MAGFTRNDVAVGRVISEDDGFLLLEIVKDESQELHLDAEPANNRFHTLLFVQFDNGGVASFRKPWEEPKQHAR